MNRRKELFGTEIKYPLLPGLLLVLVNAMILYAVFHMYDLAMEPNPVEIEDIIAGCFLLSTIFVGTVSILPNIKGLRNAFESSAESMRSSHYAVLDDMYMQILLLGLEKPHLRRPNFIMNLLERQQYDTYAFLVWNFLETIRDRSETDNSLQRTWAPIVVSEATLHWNWFTRETTSADRSQQPKFCSDFCDLIHRHYLEGFSSLLADAEDDWLWEYRKPPLITEKKLPWYCVDRSCKEFEEEKGRILADFMDRKEKREKEAKAKERSKKWRAWLPSRA